MKVHDKIAISAGCLPVDGVWTLPVWSLSFWNPVCLDLVFLNPVYQSVYQAERQSVSLYAVSYIIRFKGSI